MLSEVKKIISKNILIQIKWHFKESKSLKQMRKIERKKEDKTQGQRKRRKEDRDQETKTNNCN